jgi:hypothetical protein
MAENVAEEDLMSANRVRTTPVGEPNAQVASCALDEAGMREQRARFARLAPGIAGVTREPEAVLISFQEGFDREALDSTLAVERQCCPFFRFEVDDEARRLRVTVQEPEQLPALDAIAHAMTSA